MKKKKIASCIKVDNERRFPKPSHKDGIAVFVMSGSSLMVNAFQMVQEFDFMSVVLN